jgi:hypothetical protein
MAGQAVERRTGRLAMFPHSQNYIRRSEKCTTIAFDVNRRPARDV